MDEALSSPDPLVPAAAALAVVRQLRLEINRFGCRSLIVSCPGVLTRVSLVVATASRRELFCEAGLDHVRKCVAFVEDAVASRTKVGYETYDAWDECGETTVFHRVEMPAPEVSAARVLLDALERLTGLVARTLDLLEARAIIHGASAGGG